MKGFLTCERWLGADNPKISIATYDLESIDVLKSDAYRAIARGYRICVTRVVWRRCWMRWMPIVSYSTPSEVSPWRVVMSW